MIKRLNLVQVNFAQGPRELNAFYLPYSAGVLWSYAASIPAVAASWELNQLAWRRDTIDDVYKQLADCDVIGFSSYIWNKNYNYELARQIKAYNPRCTIVFGGPEPAIERKDLFQLHPYIDVVVKKEGEIAFANILQHGAGPQVRGIMQNDNGQAVDRGDAPRITHLDQIPSPYTTGVFDRIIAENPEVTWNSTLETNRGCPYQCTFCDWGSLTYNKVKQFDLERVFNDLEWMGRNHCDWMSITDANFGMFIKRDEAIVEKLLEVQDCHGYPRRMGVSWAKNQKADVARLSRKLMNKGFNNGLTLSVQSMDEGVLDAIKRKNLDIHKLEEMFDICAREGMSVNTELILGLPSENLASWQKNVWTLLELGQHSGIEFFQAQLLENAEMNLTQRTENAMTSITVYDYMSGADQNDAYPEGIEVVTSTKDLPLDDMLACQEFQWFINTWHINGISQRYSRFLHKAIGISYAEFYTGFQAWLLEHAAWWRIERQLVMDAYRSWMTTGSISVDPVAGVKIHGWNLIHLSNLRMHANNSYTKYLSAVEMYVDDRYGHRMKDIMLLDSARPLFDLKHISDAYVIRHDRMHDYPLQIRTNSNILDYLINDHALSVRYDPYVFELPEDKNMSLPIFLQNIYYSRRRNFGKAQMRTNA
jgi:tRNA A37 methylthiotransferase MiaB